MAAWFAPLACLRVSALGAELAFEMARIETTLVLGAQHALARHGAGLVMLHEDGVIPLVDCRAPNARARPLAGAPALIAAVRGRRFAVVVDGVKEKLAISLDELRLPGRELAARTPSLVGAFQRDGAEICLIDAERLLAPAFKRDDRPGT
jgi:chemotaxis signal transduction protein